MIVLFDINLLYLLREIIFEKSGPLRFLLLFWELIYFEKLFSVLLVEILLFSIVNLLLFVL